MKKKDFMVVLAILVIAALLYGVRFFRDSSVTESHVRIEVNGQLFQKVPLHSPQTITIAQPSGKRNVIEITSDGAEMAFSTCDNQTCIHQGKVTLDNYEFRPTQGFIICLPNRVSVELVPGVSE